MNSHKNPTHFTLWRGGKWDPERLGALLKVTQSGRGRACVLATLVSPSIMLPVVGIFSVPLEAPPSSSISILLQPTLHPWGPTSMDHILTNLPFGFWLGSVIGSSLQEFRGRLEREVGGHVFLWLPLHEAHLGLWCPSSQGGVLLLVFCNCPLIPLGLGVVKAPLLLAPVPTSSLPPPQ